jgi:hypothetical protein
MAQQAISPNPPTLRKRTDAFDPTPVDVSEDSPATSAFSSSPVSEASRSPSGGANGPGISPTDVNHPLMQDLADVSGKLSAAYAAPRPGMARQVIGALLSKKNPAIGGLVSGETQRERTIQPLQQQYGMIGQMITANRAQQLAESQERLRQSQADYYGGRNTTTEDVAKTRAAAQTGVANTKAENALDVAGVKTDSAENIAADKNTSNQTIAGQKLDSAENIAQLHDQTKSTIARANQQLQSEKAKSGGGKADPLVRSSYGDYQNSVSQLNKMNESLPAALKGDQQAMVNILMNHVGMTLGAQKGARMNQAVIKEAEQSAPWLGRINASFDSQGYLSGVKLTPDQMHSMIALGVSSQNQAKRKFEETRDSINSGILTSPSAGGGPKPGGGTAGAQPSSGAKNNDPLGIR